MLPQSLNSSLQRGFFDIADQLNPKHPLLALADTIDWSKLDDEFSPLYSNSVSYRKSFCRRSKNDLLFLIE